MFQLEGMYKDVELSKSSSFLCDSHDTEIRGGKKKTWTKPVTMGMESQRKLGAI